MNDYKYTCNWRRFVMNKRNRHNVTAIALGMGMVLVYGFVGYLEQEPVVVEAVMPVAKSGT